ncbi:MAG: hypothetical protein AAF495_20985 [Pseudomonadota bacterium]
MSSPCTPLDQDSTESSPTESHAIKAADVEALSSNELAELYARAGGRQPSAEARLKEVAEVKAVLELLMTALERDGGLGDTMQEQILAVSCEIEAKVSEALASGGNAGPDMTVVKTLLVQLVRLIERGRAEAKKTASVPEPVSLESEIMAEISAAERSEDQPSKDQPSEDQLNEDHLSEASNEQQPSEPEPAAEKEAEAEAKAPESQASSEDPAMDVLYETLRATEPPLLEQTVEGDIEVVAADAPPSTLPKCLTEPWDEKDGSGKAPAGATPATGTKGGLLAPLGRLFKKPAPKAAKT